MDKRQRMILTGEIGSGKTSFCQHLVKGARQAGLDLGGLISPGVFEEGTKKAILAVDLQLDRSRKLAILRGDQAGSLATKRWRFDPEVVAWGNRVLIKSVPCDLLVVDELGPLEFERGEGWVEGLRVLDEGEFDTALVVIRPSLVARAQQRWPGAEIIKLTGSGGEGTAAKAQAVLDRILSR